MAHQLRLLIAIICLMALPKASSANGVQDVDLADLIDRYCIVPDGDIALTSALARHDGMSELASEDFENLRLPGARQLRGFTKTTNGVVVRVLTGHNRFRGGDAGTTFFNLCWVSASPMNRSEVDDGMRREHQMRGFRQEGARVYAWVPNDDGTRRIVGSREFKRRSHAIAREDGMRMLLTNDYLGMVAVTYMVSTTDCRDWCYRD